jgi:betaine-aldehyde dehydrogenase
MAEQRPMYVGGRRSSSSDATWLDTVNPATEEVIASIPDATGDDVDQAVLRANGAARDWARRSWRDRAEVLRALADVIREHATELGLTDVDEIGLPCSAMQAEIEGAAAKLDYYAGIAGEAKGVSVPAGPNTRVYTDRSPYGVVGVIVPFNHPFRFAAGGAAAVLAAGNCVIVKPSEHSSLSALELAELADGILPPGVLSVLTGTGSRVGAAIAGHPGIPRVSFTGSVAAGVSVLAAGAPSIKDVTLELGGKNPLVVCPDVDPAAAAETALSAMNVVRCCGQSCGSTSRLFVHEEIREPFVAELAELVDGLVVGDPRDGSTQVGPLAFQAHHERVQHLVRAGVDEGARLVVGGGRPENLERGYFIEPAVFSDVSDDMTIARAEIFGPVMSVLSWTDLDEVIRRANSLPVGLTAGVLTGDVNVAHHLATALEAGYVTVNGDGRRPLGSPFGGWKKSGAGKQSSLDELLSYTREKTVQIEVASPPSFDRLS